MQHILDDVRNLLHVPSTWKRWSSMKVQFQIPKCQQVVYWSSDRKKAFLEFVTPPGEEG